METDMDTEYKAAHDKFLAAGAAFRVVQEAYRAKEIGDDAFLAGRALFIAADKEFDVAEAAFDARVSA